MTTRHLSSHLPSHTKTRAIWLPLLLTAALAPAAAQSSAVTSSDIRILQDAVFEASNDISRLRTGDAALRDALTIELDDIRDEVVYFKVKLRKNEPVTRVDVRAVQDRIGTVRRRARGAETVTAAGLPPNSPAPPPPETRSLRIPRGTEVDVRMLTSVSSRTASTGDRVEAATVRNLSIAGRVAVPAGSLVGGAVTAVGTTANPGQLSLRFDQLTFDYYTYAIDSTVTRMPSPQGPSVEVKIGMIVRLRFRESP